MPYKLIDFGNNDCFKTGGRKYKINLQNHTLTSVCKWCFASKVFLGNNLDQLE